MRYSWDREKNRRNLARHGVAFEDAQRISTDRRNYAIGLVNGVEITVVYRERNDDERRIISAWRGEQHERRTYWQNIES